MADFDKRNKVIYWKELGSVIAFYVVLLFGTGFVFSLGVPEALKAPLIMVPMIGFALGIWVVVRMFNRVDELQKQRVLRDIAISFAITGFVTFSYGFLEAVGYPRLSMFMVWIVMGSSWFAVSLFNRLRGSSSGL